MSGLPPMCMRLTLLLRFLHGLQFFLYGEWGLIDVVCLVSQLSEIFHSHCFSIPIFGTIFHGFPETLPSW